MTPRRSSPQSNPEILRKQLVALLNDFERKLKLDDHLREKVQALVPAFHTLRDLGSSLIPVSEDLTAGRSRILKYLQTYPRVIIPGDELMVVAGIDDWPRRIRELRHEQGWNIITGVTAREMVEDDKEDLFRSKEEDYDIPVENMRTTDYMMISTVQDREQAHRFRTANDIRRGSGNAHEKLLEFFKANLGHPISSEELRYVVNKSEWARRVRELRTEQGWDIKTKFTGRPDLPVGTYILESETQLPAHDRNIKEFDRRKALERDQHSCQAKAVGLPPCGWNMEKGKRTGDHRFLELHHLEHHVKGGKNEWDNLITLCNICHDRVHKKIDCKS